jgi:class 3 adenylate cyclase
MEYIIQGDTVNTAARIEALGKEYPKAQDGSVALMSGSTFVRLGCSAGAIDRGTVRLRGRVSQTRIYQIRLDDPVEST